MGRPKYHPDLPGAVDAFVLVGRAVVACAAWVLLCD